VSKIDTGGPAYPRPGYWPDTTATDRDDMHAAVGTVTDPQDGMTLRDYFAAHALAGLLAFSPEGMTRQSSPEGTAADAFAFADAMIAARADK
jgi:hypothetical protein